MTNHHHAHHFESAQAEFEASKQGMWVFLVTEVLMFGGLFVAYLMFRNLYPDMFHEAHQKLSWHLGALNTIVLILSSLTMALAIANIQKNFLQKGIVFLILTVTLAGVFLGVKAIEYHHKFEDGLLPAGFFSNKHLTHPKAPLFFSLYFMMTGLHAVHVIVGIGLIIWIIWRALNKQFSSNFFTPVELVGYYWHLVDLVWIYLFPLLYLVG